MRGIGCWTSRFFIYIYGLRVFSIFGDTFSRSREKAVFWVWEKGGENSFLHFLNILLVNRRKCEPYQWFLVNIRSEYSFSPILDNNNNCKPGFIKVSLPFLTFLSMSNIKLLVQKETTLYILINPGFTISQHW